MNITIISKHSTDHIPNNNVDGSTKNKQSESWLYKTSEGNK